MTMISENWPALLAPGLRKVFHARMRSRDDLFKRTEVFPVDTSQRAYEDYQGIGELDATSWNEFEKAGSVTYDEFEAGFKTRLEHREFAKGVNIKRKLIEDNLYPGAGIPNTVTGKVEKLADSASVHREKSAASLFVNAFTDTGLDAEGFSVSGVDGVGLCSTAHKNSPSDASTQSNEGTLALDATGLATTKGLMRRLRDDRGELISIHPDTLLVPPELEDAAIVLTKSDQVTGSPNNDVNVNKNRYNVIAWDYLTDTNAWFMIDSMLKSQHLVWLDRVLPEFQTAMNTDTMSAKFIGYQRFSRGYDAWQWIFGQNPS